MMKFADISKNVKCLLGELPVGVQLVAAAKTRTPGEVMAAVEAGVGIVGENYVQEASAARKALGDIVRWHFIGHLQKNKVKKAVEVFDLIETVDSLELAEEIDKRSRAAGKVMPIFIEINSGREAQKFGVLPEDADKLIEKVSLLENVRVMGLMTMGPFSGAPEEARPYFSETRKVFDDIKARGIPGVEMKYLSMGMTNSYRVAIEEGANMVRIGTRIFGERY
jgi:PLP dependent protein